MGNVTYLGGRNGQNPQLEKAKAEALELQNRLTRLKVEKLEGTLVEKSKVREFLAIRLSSCTPGSWDCQAAWLPSLRDLVSTMHGCMPPGCAWMEKSVNVWTRSLPGWRKLSTRRRLSTRSSSGMILKLGTTRRKSRELKRETVNRRRRETRASRAAS